MLNFFSAAFRGFLSVAQGHSHFAGAEVALVYAASGKLYHAGRDTPG